MMNRAQYEIQKENFELRLVPEQKARTLTAMAPFGQIEDLYAFVYCQESQEEEIRLVTNDDLKEWGVSRDALWEDALSQCEAEHPACLRSVRDILQQVPDPSSMDPMYVLTNVQGVFGAAAVFYRGLLTSIGQVLGQDYYLLPSSVHELIVLPDIVESDPGELKKIVQYVNREVLRQQDYLGESIYLFRREVKEMRRTA